MGCNVAKKVVCLFHGIFGWCRLDRGDGAECNKDGHIDGSTVIKQSANDLLDDFFLLLQERVGRVRQGSVLDGGTVCWDCMLMGLVLRFGGVLVAKSC